VVQAAFRALAPYFKRVVGVDLTPEMLSQATSLTNAPGNNVEYVLGRATELPFADGEADVVASRLAVHHFPDPELAIRDMVRITRPAGGRVLVMDIVCDDDSKEVRERYNNLERIRDPSHTVALSTSELVAMLQASGLRPVAPPEWKEFWIPVESWMDFTRTPEEGRDEIRKALERDLESGPPSGMRPMVLKNDGQDGIHFVHRYCLVVGERV
jgi:SAM-dependent methyltransferase